MKKEKEGEKPEKSGSKKLLVYALVSIILSLLVGIIVWQIVKSKNSKGGGGGETITNIQKINVMDTKWKQCSRQMPCICTDKEMKLQFYNSSSEVHDLTLQLQVGSQ